MEPLLPDASQRRKNHVRRRATLIEEMTQTKRNFLLLLFLIGIAVAAGFVLSLRHKPPDVVADDPRLAPGVTMRDVTFHSHALNREMQYRVFLPENAGARKLPVVYLLHGGGGTFRDWSNYSDVARFAAGALLLVMPQGDNSGVSMGGIGAVRLALVYPERFAFAGALSPAIDVPRRRFTWRRLNQSRHFEELFGPEGGETRRNNDPFLLVAKADVKALPYFYITCGKQEGLIAPNREFAALLQRSGIAHEFHAVSGGHEWIRWDDDLPGLFAALRKSLRL